ncbi:hypothetical protein NDU88_000233 [Pleurodeles waltl]|uniref:Uncharacterized protein n=1 Tax=Pleurodeles waltl TaxID=8319 RepID=A0AAV7V6F3_PLEWA|nr:hypothetical protein NDU88_000233 [Pleurodeles waltl]
MAWGSFLEISTWLGVGKPSASVVPIPGSRVSKYVFFTWFFWARYHDQCNVFTLDLDQGPGVQGSTGHMLCVACGAPGTSWSSYLCRVLLGAVLYAVRSSLAQRDRLARRSRCPHHPPLDPWSASTHQARPLVHPWAPLIGQGRGRWKGRLWITGPQASAGRGQDRELVQKQIGPIGPIAAVLLLLDHITLTTGRCWSRQRAGLGADWADRHNRGSAAAARPHRADHRAGAGRGRGRELVREKIGPIVLRILLVSASRSIPMNTTHYNKSNVPINMDVNP